MSDPMHPKDAMWISASTPIPAEVWAGGLFKYPNGVLVTRNLTKADYFAISPTEDRLAAVLGYVTPKSRIDPYRAFVLQAVDPHGWVITEMMLEPTDELTARRVLSRHGRVVAMTLQQVLRRRLFWVGKERRGLPRRAG